MGGIAIFVARAAVIAALVPSRRVAIAVVSAAVIAVVVPPIRIAIAVPVSISVWVAVAISVIWIPPTPPQGKAEVADEDYIIIMMIPIAVPIVPMAATPTLATPIVAVPVAATPALATPCAHSAASERLPASSRHRTKMAASAAAPAASTTATAPA